MPITTPLPHVKTYLDDADHFRHVYEYLFVPAIERAGYEAIGPVDRGSVLIHASFIRHLERADMVLCDVSTHNENVFLELGIRIGRDRPVALVRDHHTPPAPFDTLSIQCHTYDPTLTPWTTPEQVAELAGHLTATEKQSAGHNPLWAHFGAGHVLDRSTEDGSDVEREPRGGDGTRLPDFGPTELPRDYAALIEEIVRITADVDAHLSVRSFGDGRLVLDSEGYVIDGGHRGRIEAAARQYGLEVVLAT